MSDHPSARRLWELSSMLQRATPSTHGAWSCQLIRTECTAKELVLDFVALESCSIGELTCPAYAPFTVHVGRSDGSTAETWDRLLAMWSADADVVTISCEASPQSVLLRVTSATHDLVVRLTAETPPD